MTKKILFVVTNFSEINENIHTGVWLEEFAVPFLAFQATGYEITAPKGGIIIDKNTTIHDLMSVNVNSYYKWLYRQIIAEYDTKVRSTITDDEKKSDELLRDMRFLCEELETDIVIAKKITSLM